MRSACHGVAEAWMGIDICLFFQFGQTKYFPPSHSVLHAPFSVAYPEFSFGESNKISLFHRPYFLILFVVDFEAFKSLSG